MRKLGALLLVITCFLFNSIPVLASDIDESEDDVWKQAYRELIISDAASLSPEMKERTSYHLMNVSDNSAPMMYISYGDYASGGRICYYNEEGLHSEQTPDLYIAYVEGSDMMYWFWGHMGYYYEAAEQWDGVALTELGSGEYGADNGVLVDEDNGETAINTYIWEGKEVSREDYRALRLELWDKMVESGGEVIYTGNVPEYDYDGMLDLLTVASVPEDPETAFKPVIDEYRRAITLGAESLQPIYDFKFLELGFSGYYPGEGTVYTFYDIDHDGISEMLIGIGSEMGSRHIIEVYYLNDGEIGKLFDGLFNYRVGLHIGTDGTVMTEGSVSAYCETMTIYSVEDSFSVPKQLESYYYDSSENKIFNYMQEDGSVELFKADYYKALDDYIDDGPDYSSLDWEFFVTPVGGEYDPYPGKEPPVPPTTNIISGLYVDSSSAEHPCQINFDSKSQTYTLIMTNWYDYEVYDGPYSIDENGVIECDATIGVLSFEHKILGADELFPVHYMISGNGDAIIPVEEGLGEGDSYVRVGDGYTISPDSGSGTVTGDAVRIRCGPGTDYFFFTELYAGNNVSIIGNCGEWYRVQCYDGYGNIYRGFMHSDYISRN